MSYTTSSTPSPSDESCLVCHKALGEVGLRVINGETFCEEDAANVVSYGLIGAACKRQMELALHGMSHGGRDLGGLYGELTELFERYGLIQGSK